MIEQFTGARTNRKRIAALVATLAIGSGLTACSTAESESEVCGTPDTSTPNVLKVSQSQIVCELGHLAIKGRAPKSGYSRDAFDDGWARRDGCDVRDIILKRDLEEVRVDSKCEVLSGVLQDPYTGERIDFVRGKGTSNTVQIDHVVALGDAWQKGGQQLDPQKRAEFYNDPLNLLAVKGSANEQKGDSDAATWQPHLKSEWCRYFARQVLVKSRYDLWVTRAEHDFIDDTLSKCPNQEFSIAN